MILGDGIPATNWRVWFGHHLTLALLFLLPTFSTAESLFPVTWDFNPTPIFDVTVGDTIQFIWASTYHDVWIHPSLNCADRTGERQVSGGTSLGTVSYTFQSSDAAPDGKELFFACHVGSGLHCQSGVFQRVRVFPRLNTDAPTPSPTITPPTASPTITGQPTITPEPSPRPTSSPSLKPTTMPTATPTVSPTAVPTMAPTKRPSATPTAMPSPVPSASPSTLNPSVSPAPSGAPIITLAPTGETKSIQVTNLEMTLFGISEWSEGDHAEWESVTALYQQSYYSDTEDPGVVDFETNLKLIDSRRRRLQEGDGGDVNDEQSLILTYNQFLTYRVSNSNSTPLDLVARPFDTQNDRDAYVTLFLNNVGSESALSDVTSTSAVEGDPEFAPADSPTEAPADQPASEGSDANNNGGDKSGISTGGVIGVVAAVLFAILCACLCCMQEPTDDEYDDDNDDDDENPYIPPSPESFTAGDHPVEHSDFKD